MNSAVLRMLEPYNCITPDEYKNALKEIMQEIALLGLYRQKFFNKAAFYGGTALRIAHNLPRFSEDMDFTLLEVNKDFDLEVYLKGIEDEFSSFGLSLSTKKNIKSLDSSVDSAFLKANTLEHLLMIDGLSNPASGTNKNEKIKIKLEIDTTPPMPMGGLETLYLTLPIPFSYQVLNLPSLFGGKLHALLCREYKSGRVKGRDYYDFIWYKNKNVSPDLEYLKGKLCETGHWDVDREFGETDLKDMLSLRFEKTDWESAKKDVAPFIKDQRELDLWSSEFFKSLL
ncbi:nucleotidyl transferase AbiEii/AbiGii toxin family protein [Halobacteriovorax sp.]|uniref:nucleotidyl transferase AbiEii/AbiGii toxin family protein n=1 Tax=Halobacteriovorax sp. TaxID=2020862 RepID=UPI00356541E1